MTTSRTWAILQVVRSFEPRWGGDRGLEPFEVPPHDGQIVTLSGPISPGTKDNDAYVQISQAVNGLLRRIVFPEHPGSRTRANQFFELMPLVVGRKLIGLPMYDFQLEGVATPDVAENVF